MSETESNVEDIRDHFKKLLDTGCYSDFTIKTNGSIYRVHKSILSVRSPKFAAMFNADMRESRDGLLNLDSIDADVIGRFLLYIYTNKLEISENTNSGAYILVELFKIADEYQVLCLKKNCRLKLIEYFPSGYPIDINKPKYIFLLLDFAITYEIEELKRAILDFVVNNKNLITSWIDYRFELASQSSYLGVEVLQALAIMPKPPPKPLK